MSSYNDYNPFARRESHGSRPLAAYRLLAPLSWALVVVIGIFYSIHRPHDISNGHTIWDQFQRRFTAFSVNTVAVGIYWILLLLSQLNYFFHLFSKDDAIVSLAANVASHFILNNLFVFAWILLWTRNHFWPAEVILIAHFIHQHVVFWRIRTLPPLSHLSVVAAPYAWTLITLFWNGAVAVHKYTTAADIAANVFIWVIFVIGAIHVFSTADDLLGYSLSLLTLGLAVEQYDHKHIPRQWIFAWVIFAVFFVDSLYITTTKYSGRTLFLQRTAEPESSDAERAPLLNDALPGPAATS
ncbi:hypothetical protein BDW59DRAFT_139238 [Aspergillus cavernicola]|uniref:DUF1774-domain-containing protein n=1 Tax=Aspergillus cavernicola TaxID=176166 RepID=A0ABR4IXD1_9EURO